MISVAPHDIVEQFLAQWPKGLETLCQSLRDYLAEDVDYENVGLTHCRSVAESIALIENFMPGLDSIGVDMLSIAAGGEKVLTERIDHLRPADGTLLASLRVTGIFEVRSGKIVAWRDYFDTAPGRPARSATGTGRGNS